MQPKMRIKPYYKQKHEGEKEATYFLSGIDNN